MAVASGLQKPPEVEQVWPLERSNHLEHKALHYPDPEHKYPEVLVFQKIRLFFENKHFSWESRQKKSNTKRKLSILVYKLSGFSAASERGER